MQLSDLTTIMPILVTLLNSIASFVRDYFTSRLNKRSWDEVMGAIDVFERWENADDYLLYNLQGHINYLIENRIEIKKPLSPIVVSIISIMLELYFICDGINRKENVVLISAVASLILIVYILIKVIKSYRHFDRQKEERRKEYLARQDELADALVTLLSNQSEIGQTVSDREMQISIENRLLRTLVDFDVHKQAYMNRIIQMAKERQKQPKGAD